MSATNCEDPDHERCERCSGCVPCGCLCHLVGEGVTEETSEPESPDSLLSVELGLRPFQHETLCPKCSSTGIRAVYHPVILVTVGAGQYPCGEWLLAGTLTDDVTAHLCLRCLRCGYGWPTETADTPPVEGLE
jgi:hypothetical protein